MLTTISGSFIAIGWTVRALVGKVQHRVLQLVQFSNFLNFQNHRGNVYNNLWKFHRNRMNGMCSYTGHTHTHAQKKTHTHTKTLIFIYRLNFQDHREHFYNNFWKLRRNRMNGVCSCRTTPNTPASTIFKFLKFPKSPRACLQQFLKVSSQSEERCVLL